MMLLLTRTTKHRAIVLNKLMVISFIAIKNQQIEIYISTITGKSILCKTAEHTKMASTLLLTMSKDEEILLNNNIVFKVKPISNSQVAFAINAPKEITICREEVMYRH